MKRMLLCLVASWVMVPVVYADDPITAYLKQANGGCYVNGLAWESAVIGAASYEEAAKTQSTMLAESKPLFVKAVAAAKTAALKEAVKGVRVQESSCINSLSPTAGETRGGWYARRNAIQGNMTTAVFRVQAEMDLL